MKMGSGEGSTTKNLIVCFNHLTVRAIKCGRLRWAGHVAKIEECRNAFTVLLGKPTGKRSLGRPIIDMKTVLECMLNKYTSIRGT